MIIVLIIMIIELINWSKQPTRGFLEYRAFVMELWISQKKNFQENLQMITSKASKLNNQHRAFVKIVKGF